MKTEQQLNSLMTSIRVLSSTRELPDVLRQLLQEALHVIDGSTAGVLFLYDEQQNTLYAESAIGFKMASLGKVRLKPGEGMSGKTFQQKQGSIYMHMHDTKKGMGNLSAQNAQYYEQSLPELTYPVSALSVPLFRIDGSCIGVLTVDIFKRDHLFDAYDLELLETFARQASIAIENARLYSQNKRTQDIHHALSKVSLSNGGIDDITAALARLLSKDVVVLNEFAEELSRFPQQLQSPITKEHFTEITHSFIKNQTTGVQTTLFRQEGVELYTFPIQIETDPLGFLIVISHADSLLNSLDQVAIEQALPIFVMELHQREKQDVDDLLYTGRLLEMAIHSIQPESAVQELFMHVPTTNEHHYIIAKIQLEHGSMLLQQNSRLKQSFMRKVYFALSKLPEPAIVYERHVDLTFLFPVSSQHSYAAIESCLVELLDYVKQKWGLIGYAGIGQARKKLTDLKNAYTEAVKAIHFLKRKQQPHQVIHYTSLGPYQLFLTMDEEVLRKYVHGQLGDLVIDEANKDLLHTLFVYMEQGQRLKEAARSLFVHVNTVKYRLKKIYEHFDISAFTPSHSFELHLALKIAHYLEIISFSDSGQKRQ
ncbi:helix-turn-helix domain-containing protein [Shouchella sp. JSM 1781072]|uniref:helix-turn-helix domain-containing protein n=1 Tax=Shouchella sp. JSM 1781072 TaxID=3344581 RepID=UPI0035BF746A